MKKISILLFALMATTFVSAQFDVSVLGSLPTGDFSDDKGRDDDGFAKFGFGASVGYHFQTGVEGLSIYPSIGFILNGSDRFEEIADNLQQANQGFTFDSEGGNYFNVPITVGPSYKGEIGSGTYIYGTGHIGLAMSFVGDGEVSTNTNNVNFVQEYEINSPVSFAGGIEAGVILAEQFKLGVQFLSLGEPEFETELTQTQQGQQPLTQNSETEQPISMFLIKLGIVFN